MASSATTTQTLDKAYRSGKRIRKIEVAWTAHTDGSFTDYEITEVIDGEVFMVVTNPGATAPQADYDIDLKDSDGVDIMGATLDDRSASGTEQAAPLVGAAYCPRFVDGKLTLAISGNNVNGAVGVISIYVES